MHPDETATWPAGPGEMARRIRAHDWAATPLGPVGSWPQSLRTVADLVLAMPTPATILWGPAYVQIYNDAYVPIAKDRHPALLGKPVAEGWPDAYPEVIRPLLDTVAAGEAAQLAETPVLLRSSDGGTEQRFFDTTWSPIRDEAGEIAGALQTLQEVTDRRRAAATQRDKEERQAFLLNLSDAMRAARDPVSTGVTATRLLGEHLRVDRCWIAQLSRNDGLALLGPEYTAPGIAPFPDQVPLSAFPLSMQKAGTGSLSYSDVQNDASLSAPEKGVMQAIGIGSYLAAVLRRGERNYVWGLAVCSSGPRAWTGDELALLEEVAERTWAAIERVRAESALNESEERFRQFAESTADVLWIVDAHTRRLEYLSPAYEQVWGEPRDAVMADLSHWAERIHPEDLPGPGEGIESLFAGEPYTAEYRIRLADGRTRHIHDTGFPIFDEAGGVRRVAGIAHDFTAQHETGVALAQSEQRLRSLLEGIPQLVWRAVDGGHWTWAGPQWTGYTGQAEPDSHGLGWLDAIHPDDHHRAMQAWSLAQGADRFEVEYRVRNAAADRYCWFKTRALPVWGKSGDAVEWLGTSTDIDALRTAEIALQQSEERYRLIVESASDYAILVVEPNGIISDWLPGAEAVFGWTRQEAVGRPAGITFTPQDQAEDQPQRERDVAAEHGSAPDVRWHQRKDGGLVFIEGAVTPLHNPDGTVRAFLKIGQDVTERRHAHEMLEASERRMRNLATGIPQLVFRSHGNGERIWGSPQWIAFTGLSFEESLGLGWTQAVHPDDREATLAAWSGVEARGEYYCEHRICHAATGGYRWHQTRATPLRDEEGRTLEWLGTSNDVEELRRLQRHQQMLLAELQHRVRNTLGVVRSIARRTAELSANKDELASHLQGRLAAFSRVQAAVTRTPVGGVGLMSIVEDELVAHAARESEAVVVNGPELLLKSRPAESLSLAIHELTSNAVKYGALSEGMGLLSIRWTVEERDGERWLSFRWEEGGMSFSGEPPARRGFGMELLERTLPYELDAVTRADFQPTGFRFAMDLPLANLVVESSAGIG